MQQQLGIIEGAECAKVWASEDTGSLRLALPTVACIHSLSSPFQKAHKHHRQRSLQMHYHASLAPATELQFAKSNPSLPPSLTHRPTIH